MQPTFPLITVFPEGYLDVVEEKGFLGQKLISRLGGPPNKEVYYDAAGRKWQFVAGEPLRRVSAWSRFWARIWKDEYVAVHYTWALLDTYSLPELKGQIYICVNNDDDILTQWVDAETIKRKIRKATDFKTIWEDIHFLFTENDENKLFAHFT